MGITTVVDHMVQQTMAQGLEPILERLFSESSFGFRLGRGTHDALRQAAQYVEDSLPRKMGHYPLSEKAVAVTEQLTKRRLELTSA